MKFKYILLFLLFFISSCTTKVNFVEISDVSYYYEYWVILIIVFILLYIIHKLLRMERS